MGQNTSNSVWKPCEDLQKTFDLCHCQQRVYNKVLRLNFVIDQILISHHNLQINSLKILQCDFLDFFFLILYLIVEVYLWWKLQASLIFLSGRTCTIGGWLNTFLPHCIYIYNFYNSFFYIFIQQECIKLLKSDSKDIYNVTEDFCFKNICVYIYIYIYIQILCIISQILLYFWPNKCNLCEYKKRLSKTLPVLNFWTVV